EGRTRRFTRLMARFPIPGPARSTELRLGERPGAAGRDIRRGWRDGAPDARPRLGRYAARPARAVAEQPESRSAPAAHLEVRDVAVVVLRHPLLLQRRLPPDPGDQAPPLARHADPGAMGGDLGRHQGPPGDGPGARRGHLGPGPAAA